MKHTQLRFALLASLGALPLACGGGTSEGLHYTSECTAPQTDPNTGLVRCDEGYTHRPTAVTCGGMPTPGVDQKALPRQQTPGVSCATDTGSCGAYQYGYCEVESNWSCLSGCLTDQDCESGFICACGDLNTWGKCQRSNCATDADCAPGYRCASTEGFLGVGFTCQTPRDTCWTRQDCDAASYCELNADGTRHCALQPAIGRPFLVAQQIRVAPIVRRSDWLLI